MAGKFGREPVFLSLGSNLGDRYGNLRRAVGKIAEIPEVDRLRVSSVYETESVGLTDQPLFLNIVLGMETGQEPQELLARLNDIEDQLGRVRNAPGGPRTIDIDILLFGSREIETGRLTVPHPRMAERRFVLEPLSELEPELVHPPTGKSVGTLLSEIGDSGGWVKRLEPWPGA